MKIKSAFVELAFGSVPRSEIRLLLSEILGRDAAWLIANDDYTLSEAEAAKLHTAVARRRAGEPIAYILGYREFYGRRFKCSPSALIPRPETELLVDEVIRERSTAHARKLRVLDVGTGSGCIAVTLALELTLNHIKADVIACDLSRDALALARENAKALQANVSFIESDWFSAFDAVESFDVIVSNPPYIAPNDPHLFQGDLRFEPWLALQDRVDGLQSYRELLSGAKKHLKKDGLLIVEHGYDQGETVPALFAEAGLGSVEMIRDLAGQPRITKGKSSRRG